MNQNCEYCGAALPKGVDKSTRRIRSAHFARHPAERKQEYESALGVSYNPSKALMLAGALAGSATPYVGMEREAAAELRRLDALCGEMGKSLEASQDQIAAGPKGYAVFQNNVVVLQKWKESK